MQPSDVFDEFLREFERAERKFPTFPKDIIHAAAIVSEEAGELVRAANQVTYEKGHYVDVMKEAVQTGAMALRFILNFCHFEERPSEQIRRENKVVNE